MLTTKFKSKQPQSRSSNVEACNQSFYSFGKATRTAMTAESGTPFVLVEHLRQSKFHFASTNHEIKFRTNFGICVRLPCARRKLCESFPAQEMKCSATDSPSFSIAAAFSKAVRINRRFRLIIILEAEQSTCTANVLTYEARAH